MFENSFGKIRLFSKRNKYPWDDIRIKNFNPSRLWGISTIFSYKRISEIEYDSNVKSVIINELLRTNN